jgi:O-antigen ligase
LFLAIGVLFIISTGWNALKETVPMPGTDTTQRELVSFFTRFLFLIFFLYFVRTERAIVACVVVFLALTVVVAGDALIFYVREGGIKRAAASFGMAENSNRFAFACLFATSILWFYRLHGRSRRLKILSFPLILFFPVMVLASGSRSGFLQLIILMVFAVKELGGWSVTRRVRSAILILCLGLLIFTLAPSRQLVRALTFRTEVDVVGGRSLQRRLERVYHAAQMIASDPVFGVGIGNFAQLSRSVDPAGGKPHNSYTWALTAGGFGVLFLYLRLFYLTYNQLKTAEAAASGALLGLVKAFRVNMVLFLVFTAFADFWLSELLYFMDGVAAGVMALQAGKAQVQQRSHEGIEPYSLSPRRVRAALSPA